MVLAFVLFCRLGAWAQEESSYQPAPERTEIESELARAEQEMKSRLEELEHLNEEQKAIEQSIEDAKTLLIKAEMSGDTTKRTKALDIKRAAEEALFSIVQKISSTQQLYNQAAESYRIVSESAKLLKEAALSDAHKTPIKEVIQKKTQAERAEKGAELAEQKVTTLQEKLEILSEQQKRLINDIDKSSEQLDEQSLPRKQRNGLLQSRQDLMAKQKELETNMVKLRQELVAAKVEQRIKWEKAAEETVKYKKWQQNILKSFFSLLPSSSC